MTITVVPFRNDVYFLSNQLSLLDGYKDFYYDIEFSEFVITLEYPKTFAKTFIKYLKEKYGERIQHLLPDPDQLEIKY